MNHRHICKSILCLYDFVWRSARTSMWWPDERSAVTKQLYLPFRSVTVRAHHFHNHCPMTTVHMTSIISACSSRLAPPQPLLTEQSPLLRCCNSCAKELDTANGFMHTYTAGPRLFTSSRQWKEWCGIIHRWLKGIHGGTTADLYACLQDGKSLSWSCRANMRDEDETFPEEILKLKGVRRQQ